MPQAIQEAPGVDNLSAWFLGLYALAACVLLLASLAFSTCRPVAQDRKPSGLANRGRLHGSWQRFVGSLARLPISPNQVSVIGLLLVLANCGIFVAFANPFWFGSGLIAAFLFDTLDGQIARAQNRTSRLGAYLDAVIDRYQEAAVFLALGLVTGEWLPVFLAAAGSMLVSYNKARIAMEHPTANKSWPDLMERPLRLTVLCFALIAERALPGLLVLSLWFLAAATHFTAVQRFVRAVFILSDADEAARRAEAGH